MTWMLINCSAKPTTPCMGQNLPEETGANSSILLSPVAHTEDITVAHPGQAVGLAR
jgi:hypothetical protein